MIFTVTGDSIQTLENAGYKLIKENDLIFQSGRHRFHAKIIGWDTIDLHFDKDHIDDYGKHYHSSSPKDCVKTEIRRIKDPGRFYWQHKEKGWALIRKYKGPKGGRY